MIFVVPDDIARKFLLHLFWIDTLNVNFFDLIFTNLFIKRFIIERPRLRFDVKFTQFHSECIGHFSFELPQFLAVVNLDNNVGLVRTKSDLYLFKFILGILTLVLFKDVIPIEARDIAFNQLETVQLIVMSLRCLLDVLEAPVWEYFID